MKKIIFTFLTGLFVTVKPLAQQGSSILPPVIKGRTNAVYFGANIPVGEFSQTHIVGISLEYSWSRDRFGKMSRLPSTHIGFAANGGIDYYFGKSETVAGNPYKYGGYFYLHAFGGAIYNPCKKGNIMMTAGPTMGFYKSGTHLGLGANLNGSYYFNERVAITPGVLYMKHKEANALCAVTLKVGYSF